ncbi:MAG TPA: hypothetical protein P5154_07090, partial [Candidatus Izemoplasmatales bacterium]|nr:hypothetical protein [Candidatus Izemoplasmatales bacterium]
PNGPLQKIQIPGLDAKKTFQIRNRPQYFNLRTFGDLVRHALPIRLRADGMLFNALSNRYLMSAETEDLRVEGDLLQSFGFIPKQPFIGTGYNDQVRLMGDFGSRIYHLRAERKS